MKKIITRIFFFMLGTSIGLFTAYLIGINMTFLQNSPLLFLVILLLGLLFSILFSSFYLEKTFALEFSIPGKSHINPFVLGVIIGLFSLALFF